MKADQRDRSPPSFTRRPWVWRLALLVVSLTTGLAMAELSLRWIGLGSRRPIVADPFKGIAGRPDSTFDFAGEGRSQSIRFNALGFRDIDRAQVKPEGVYRIAVLGDSYIEAPQVAVADRVTEQLEAELNRRGTVAPLEVEVLNFGFSTYGTMQELQVLERDVWRFAPDLVILAFLTGNDVQNNCRDLLDEPNRPYLDLRDGVFEEAFPPSPTMPATTWSQESRLLGLWNKIRYQRSMHAKRQAEAKRYRFPDGPEARGLEAGLDAGIYLPPSEPAWDYGWRITEELLRRFNEACLAHDTDWLLVVLSNGIQVHPEMELRETFRRTMGHSSLLHPEERLKEAARRDGYAILCLAPLLGTIAERDRVFLHGFENMQPGFGHWNEQGHRAAAGLIADRLPLRSTRAAHQSGE